MKHERIHEIFHSGSRFIIALPIIIIVLALVFKPSTTQTLSSQSRTTSPAPTIPDITRGPSPTPTPVGIPVDLNGPYVCSFVSEDMYEGTLYIKNKNVYADVLERKTNKLISVLLNGDCIYKWEKNTKAGSKMCGVSKYVTLMDKMSQWGILNAETVMNIAVQYISPEFEDQKVPATDCRKGAIADTMFQVPKTITFQNKSLPGVSVSPTLPKQ